MTVYNAFRDYLVDYGELRNRFEHLLWIWEKYVLKFAHENSFELIKEALANEDYEGVRSYTHRMKGDALNLGFCKLTEVCENMLVVLKENPGDKELIEEAFKGIEKIFGEMQEIYKLFDEEPE